MTIDINRKERHVTLSMPGYITKLHHRVRPQGVKGATTPTIDTAPNYKSSHIFPKHKQQQSMISPDHHSSTLNSANFSASKTYHQGYQEDEKTFAVCLITPAL
jgi:hypothetical protein